MPRGEFPYQLSRWLPIKELRSILDPLEQAKERFEIKKHKKYSQWAIFIDKPEWKIREENKKKRKKYEKHKNS